MTPAGGYASGTAKFRAMHACLEGTSINWVNQAYPGHYVQQNPPVEHPDTTEIFGFAGWRSLSVKLNYSLTNSFGNPDPRGPWYLDMSANTPKWEGWSAGVHVDRREVRGSNPANGFDNSRLSYTDYELYTLNGYDLAGNHFVFRLPNHFDPDTETVT